MKFIIRLLIFTVAVLFFSCSYFVKEVPCTGIITSIEDKKYGDVSNDSNAYHKYYFNVTFPHGSEKILTSEETFKKYKKGDTVTFNMYTPNKVFAIIVYFFLGLVTFVIFLIQWITSD